MTESGQGGGGLDQGEALEMVLMRLKLEFPP